MAPSARALAARARHRFLTITMTLPDLLDKPDKHTPMMQQYPRMTL